MDQKQNEDKILRMKELHRQLLAASRAYYQESREIMSNFEYDRLYDELLELEKETGAKLTVSAEDFIGGVRAVIRSRNILMDHSFKTQIQDEYDKFLFLGGDGIA